MEIKEKIIKGFSLEECSKEEQEDVIDDLVSMAVEESLIEAMNKMGEKELALFQDCEGMDHDSLLKIIDDNKDSLDKFLVVFNEKIDKAIELFEQCS